MATLLELFAMLGAWKQHPRGDNPFRLSCRIDRGASAAEIARAVSGTIVPEELRQLWTACREAWLFEDAEYGQWGLHLLSPSESLARTEIEIAQRADQMLADDLVVGEFLGDSELLVYASSGCDDRRCLIALPLDSRDEWFAAGASIAEVLQRLLAADGEKYWESAPA